MSLLKLPKIKGERIGSVQFDARPDALKRWEPSIQAAIDGEASIGIYEQIGESWDGSGMTAKRMSAILRGIGASRDITVNLNSPGGDFFEGVAIYNLLRQHQAKVTVNVMGLAASAASIIAMAGDDINMGEGSFLMIHNAWCMAIGNRHDMQAAAEQLAPFDNAMAEVYAARAGITVKAAAKLMDAESWIGATQAIEQGFATGMMDTATITDDTKASASTKYLAMVDTALAKAGHPRSERREALKTLFSGTPSAAESPTPSAGFEAAKSLQSLIDTIRN
ncbi:MAG: peptidase [Comamonadaceae bacterium CG2_30_59_20]|nr:MAG: peptidase [Comamonadaceae bacterium CG2_30_59_20]